MSAKAWPDKWIDGLDAAASVTDAAQRVLKQRVGVVAVMARKVVKSKAQDDEEVHQLRVATRRAEAALLAFKPWMRQRRRKQTKKILRLLRKAAGAVRSTDVHRAILLNAHRDADADVRSVIESSLACWDRERLIALRDLRSVARRSLESIERDGRRWAKRDDTEESNGERTPALHEAGTAALAELARAFRELGDSHATSREHLHELRVQGKRLRYAIEIFGATASDSSVLAAISDELTSVQDQLGHVNDVHEVAERLSTNAAAIDSMIAGPSYQRESTAESHESSLSPRLMQLAEEFEQRCNQAASEFLSWWDSDGARAFRANIETLAGGASVASAADSAAVPEITVLATNSHLANPVGETAALVGASEQADDT